MRRPIFLLLLIGMSSFGRPTANQVGAVPFSILITGPEKPVKAGSEVKIGIVLKNTSDREIAVGRTSVSQAEFHYLVDVRDGKGHPAPNTEYGRRIMGREAGERTIIFSSGDALFTLKPNETLEDEAVVSKLYDLSRPGKYFIQAIRKPLEKVSTGQVKSNTITITIVP